MRGGSGGILNGLKMENVLGWAREWPHWIFLVGPINIRL